MYFKKKQESNVWNSAQRFVQIKKELKVVVI